MKRTIAILMTLLIMTFAMTGCGSETSASDSVDVDLSTLSTTMMYSEVSNMYSTTDDYIGKTVKMSGQFTVYDDGNGGYFTAVTIQDNTQCCSQGLEFRLKGDAKYPDDYPEADSEITVVGTFETYEEGDATYACLMDAEIES